MKHPELQVYLIPQVPKKVLGHLFFSFDAFLLLWQCWQVPHLPMNIFMQPSWLRTRQECFASVPPSEPASCETR